MNVSGVPTSFIHLLRMPCAEHSLKSSPHSKPLFTRETQAQKPDSVIQTIPGDFKLFKIRLHFPTPRQARARGSLKFARNVFWRNCVTGPRGSWGHMYTFQASCNCAPALISSMLLGTRQKAKPGRLDRTVQSDTDRARDKRTGLWYTLTEWNVFAHSFSSFARILCGYRTVITWQLWLYRK